MSTEPTSLILDRLELIRPLLGLDIAVAVQDPLGTPPPPFAEESAGLSAKAVAKRRNEFAAGRAAAHAAMEDLGLSPRPVIIGPKRAPIWPEGLVGSISHCRSFAVAAVARQGNIRAIGIDVEEDTPLSQDLMPAICSAEERAWLDRQYQPGQLAKVIFSAKEAAYKGQYTLSQCFFGFDGMQVDLDLPGGRFQAVFTAERGPFHKGAVISGRFAIGHGIIATTTEIRA